MSSYEFLKFGNELRCFHFSPLSISQRREMGRKHPV
jgi:hypothetical protein